jgi:hypothetical protein
VRINFLVAGIRILAFAINRDSVQGSTIDKRNSLLIIRLKAEQEKQFSDLERRWLSRERSRTAALEREKKLARFRSQALRSA